MRERRNQSEIETELKIKLSIGDMEKVFQTLSKMSSASEINHKFLPRMYYDTPDLQLHNRKISLRVQYRSGKAGQLGGYEQTVKFALSPAAALGQGVLFRKECKNILDGHTPDLAAVTDREAQGVIKSFKNKTLVPIFTAAIERRAFDWKLKHGKKTGVVEIAFDAGKIILLKDNKHSNFTEIELEIKQGGAEFIDIVRAKILSIAPSARIQRLSKSEQGIAFYLKHKK